MRTALLACVFCCATPVFAQPPAKVAEDAAMTPVEDVNLKHKEIPPVLLSAQEEPYAAANTRNCGQLTAALGELDAALGPDFDSAVVAKHGLTATSISKSVVGSFIPFRGVIREVSGAAGAQRRYDAAVDAGIARRGYLRGIAKSRGCKRAAAEAAAAN